EREFERVGGTQTIRVDVRILAATHRNLEEMIAAGTMREDLFYRLNVVPITIPPLRDRSDDAARLVRHFVREFAATAGRPAMRIDEDAIALLAAQPWPGNVRQLQNFVERLVVLADETTIRRIDVERELERVPRGSSSSATEAKVPAELSLDARRKETEKEA